MKFFFRKFRTCVVGACPGGLEGGEGLERGWGRGGEGLEENNGMGQLYSSLS